MPCYHPLKARKEGINIETGKDILKVFSFSLDQPYDYIIPCGQCVGCRLDHSREWADRIMLEALYHESCYFLTLTYDDDHLKYSSAVLDLDEDEFIDQDCFKLADIDHVTPASASVYLDVNTGEILNDTEDHPVLCKRDVQLFLKRLRKNSGQQLRYFYCGEYGPSTLRPHYHMVVFGLFLDDLELYRRGEHPLYTSKFLTSVWQNGHVVIGDVSWDSAAYVARYCVGKSYRPQDYQIFARYGLVKPYICMSRRPGIGLQYYKDYKDSIFSDQTQIIPGSNGKRLFPPKYFRSIYEEEEPEMALTFKENRRVLAIARIEAEMAQTDIKDYEKYLSLKEQTHIKKAKMLVREDV